MHKLLIVEDERWEREGLADFLDWNSFDIEIAGTACDGVDGLEQAIKIRPDIIITDIKMPGMDGIAMSKKIKEFLPEVKIIILTGYDDFQYAKEAISFNASGYLLKIMEEEEMIQLITKVVGECKKDKERVERELAINNKLLEKSVLQRAIEDLNEKRYNKDELIIKKVIKIIEDNYMLELSLKGIAGEVYLSPNYLGALFKKCTDKSINEYICEFRLEKAKELLKSPKNRVNQVAAKVGIPNTSYFCTLFKNAIGMAPGEYQEIFLNNTNRRI